LWSREMLTFRMLTSLAVTFTAQHSNASQNISTVPKSKCAACQVSGPGSGLGPGPGLGLGLGLKMEGLTRASLAKSTFNPHLKTHRPRREEDAQLLPPSEPRRAAPWPGQNQAGTESRGAMI
jgi:hypothetical protein